MKQTKKSILGLNTVKAFIIVLLALAIIGVVTLVILGSLNTAAFVAQTGVTAKGSVVNESLLSAPTEAASANLAVYAYNSVQCTVTSFINQTGATEIPSTNYTVSNCAVTFKGGNTYYNNTIWKATYTYTYKYDNGASGIISNTSTGIISFFTNASTYFSLLGVVVIILIISLVVVVVNRFGGEQPSGTI